jgi:hypothetical protein
MNNKRLWLALIIVVLVGVGLFVGNKLQKAETDTKCPAPVESVETVEEPEKTAEEIVTKAIVDLSATKE